MNRYTLREPSTVDAILWTGDNLHAVKAFLRLRGYEAASVPSGRLVVVDSSGASRWFFSKDHYLIPRVGGISSLSKSEFEELYTEAQQ